jgi:hypothetical protein
VVDHSEGLPIDLGESVPGKHLPGPALDSQATLASETIVRSASAARTKPPGHGDRESVSIRHRVGNG